MSAQYRGIYNAFLVVSLAFLTGMLSRYALVAHRGIDRVDGVGDIVCSHLRLRPAL